MNLFKFLILFCWMIITYKIILFGRVLVSRFRSKFTKYNLSRSKYKVTDYLSDSKVKWTKFTTSNGIINYSIMHNTKNDTIEIRFKCDESDTNIGDAIQLPRYVGKFTYTDEEYYVKSIHLFAPNDWVKLYSTIKLEIRERFNKLYSKNKDSKVLIIGNSIGGVMAQLCAQDLNFIYNIKSVLITFGSPNVWLGNPLKLNTYLESIFDYNSVQISSISDVYTMLPLEYTKPCEYYIGEFNLKDLINIELTHDSYDDKVLYGRYN